MIIQNDLTFVLTDWLLKPKQTHTTDVGLENPTGASPKKDQNMKTFVKKITI